MSSTKNYYSIYAHHVACGLMPPISANYGLIRSYSDMPCIKFSELFKGNLNAVDCNKMYKPEPCIIAGAEVLCTYFIRIKHVAQQALAESLKEYYSLSTKIARVIALYDTAVALHQTMIMTQKNSEKDRCKVLFEGAITQLTKDYPDDIRRPHVNGGKPDTMERLDDLIAPFVDISTQLQQSVKKVERVFLATINNEGIKEYANIARFANAIPGYSWDSVKHALTTSQLIDLYFKHHSKIHI